MAFWNKPKPETVDWEAKYKKAITDLAAARDEVEEWKTLANDLGAIVEATKDDAAAMRRKRQMDRDRRKGVAS